MATKKQDIASQVILLSRISGAPSASYLVYHPERKLVLPKLCHLNWTRLEHITRTSVVSLKEYIYIIGGYDTKRKKYLKTVMRYDTEKGSWYYCTKMKIPRADFCAIVYDGRIYCAGGSSTGNGMITDTESYEPLTNQWYKENPLPFPCAGYAAAGVDGVGPLIIGGVVKSPSGSLRCSNYCWQFSKQKSDNPYLDFELMWTSLEVARFPSANGVAHHKIVLDKNKERLYVIGGICTAELPAKNSKLKDASKNYVCSDQSLEGVYYFDIKELRGYLRSKSNLSTKAKKPQKMPIIWRKRQVAECQRIGAAVCAIDTKLVVFGGKRVLQKLSDTPADQEQNIGVSKENTQVLPVEESSEEDSEEYPDDEVESVSTTKSKRHVRQTLKLMNQSATKSMERALRQLEAGPTPTSCATQSESSDRRRLREEMFREVEEESIQSPEPEIRRAEQDVKIEENPGNDVKTPENDVENPQNDVKNPQNDVKKTRE